MDLPLLKNDLKALIVKELNLEGRDPATIQDTAQLFGPSQEGQAPSLGLDSLDALQLAMSIEEKFGVRIPEGPEARSIFASVDAIAAYVADQKKST
jgi:acyl carrier protein